MKLPISSKNKTKKRISSKYMIFEPCFHADKIYPPREKKNVYKRKSDKNYCGQTWNHSAPNSDHFKGSFVDFRMEMTFTLPKLL